ncbi:MAG TPA: ABC transporter permease [Rhodanobacter sp.]|nr:ABC transporter permease [Rhodanobacter sp.]
MFRYYLMLALRRCRQNLPMVALVVLTMAVGIASSMTALTIFQALSGEPLPGISSHLYVVSMDARDSLADTDSSTDAPSYLKLDDARALVDAHRATQQVALAEVLTTVSRADAATGNAAAHTENASGVMAYGPLIPMFGIPLKYGRSWTAQEQAAHAPVVVIAAKLSRELFGSEDTVGRQVRIGDRNFQVIGVSDEWAPKTQFFDLERNSGAVTGQSQSLFMPLDAALQAGVGPMTSGNCDKGAAAVSFGTVDVSRCRWLETWVSLPMPGDVAAFQQFVSNVAEARHRDGSFAHSTKPHIYSVDQWMNLKHVVPDDVRLNVALAGAFLLLCMVNVAGLLAARFMRRQSDVAIRRALGASRRTVFAQHLVETGVLGVIGGLLAAPLTLLGLWIVRQQPVGYADAAELHLSVFLGLLVLSILVGMVVGVLPAWRVCRLQPALQIKQA